MKLVIRPSPSSRLTYGATNDKPTAAPYTEKHRATPDLEISVWSNEVAWIVVDQTNVPLLSYQIAITFCF